jgi:15-cis-phytoene synthase
VLTASEITHRAKSNLAFALKILPRERREDMVVFYAFCRTIDDLADDPAILAGERRKALDAWEKGICEGFDTASDFQQEVISLRDRHQIPNERFTAIIDGCRMDLQPQRFRSWEDLSSYIWKVACAVGLVSVRIFGCQSPESERYAVALGHALQLTNILRDIQEDWSNGGRVYLPMEDLVRFHYTEQDLASGLRNEAFLTLMDFQAARATSYFKDAESLVTGQDREALLPARIMAEIYHLLLNRMHTDRFHVFKKRYRLSQVRKLAILSKHLIARSH